MRIPGFNAEASFHTSGSEYRDGAEFLSGMAAVVPAILSLWHVCGPCTHGYKVCRNYIPGPPLTVGLPFATRC
jgi:hypothetical protein